MSILQHLESVLPHCEDKKGISMYILYANICKYDASATGQDASITGLDSSTTVQVLLQQSKMLLQWSNEKLRVTNNKEGGGGTQRNLNILLQLQGIK